MKYTIKIIAIILILSCLSILAEGSTCPDYQTYPPTGNGIVRNVANQSQLEAALNAAQPGDVINLATGIYEKVIYRKAFGHANGTAANPIVIQAGDGQSPVIDGGGYNLNGDQYADYNGVYVARRNYIIVRGLEIRFAGFGLIFQNVTGGKIEHNVIHNVGDAALAVQAYWNDDLLISSFVEIKCNEIYNTGNYSAEFAEGIYIGSGSSSRVDRTHDILIKGNDIYNISNEPIDVKKYSYNITIEDNFIHDSTPWNGGAISLGLNKDNWQNGNYLVQRNYIWNISSGDNYAQAIAVGHGTTTIRNNVIWNIETLSIPWHFRHVIQIHNSDSPDATAYGFGNPNAKDVYIYNNTIWGCSEDCVSNYAAPNVIIPNVTTRNNLLSSLSGGVVSASTDLLAQANYFEGSITGNADAGTGVGSGFNLVAANAAVDDATSLNSFNDDILGNARPQGNSWDFGAFERLENCPAVGTPCNDNDPTTVNDAEDGNCNCIGMPIPPANDCDLITNGDFNNNTIGWDGWGCNINNVLGACQVTNIQQVEKPWKAIFAQGNFTLEQGKQYKVSFDASSIQNNRTIRVKVGLSDDPWTDYNNDYAEIYLTTNNQRITRLFTMSEPTISSARLEFHIGTNITGLIVDNVQLVSLSDDCGDNNNTSTITIHVRGNTGAEDMTLTVNGQTLGSWSNIQSGNDYSTYSVTVNNETTINSIRVNSTSGEGWPHALIVDKIVIDGTSYQSEAGNTESYGSWTESTDCAQGYKYSQWLSCPNAWFEYRAVRGLVLASSQNREGIETITHYEIFPNPVNDNLNVSFHLTDDYDTGIIRLFDLNGRTILEEEKALSNTNQFQLNIQAIPAGMYMLRVDVGGYFLTHKVVKY